MARTLLMLALSLALAGCASAHEGDACSADGDCGGMKCLQIAQGTTVNGSCTIDKGKTCHFTCATDADCASAKSGATALNKCGSDCAGNKLCVPTL